MLVCAGPGIEAALRASNEWFAITLSSIGDAVIATDIIGTIMLMNPVAEKLTGWTWREAKGKRLDELLHLFDPVSGEEIELPTKVARRSNAEARLPANTMLRTRDGRDIPIDDIASPINDPSGKVIGSVIVFRDVSEQRKADELLRVSELEFHTLAESIPQLAWMADKNGNIFWYNQQWYDYTGTTPEQMKGWGWQSVHDPKILPRVLEGWQGSIASGKHFDMVFPLRGADGTFRPFLTRVNPFKDADGQVIRWFGTNTDITERVQMEAALKEADRRKDEFLAMLAHELRNPLSSVSNAIQLLRMPAATAEHAEWSKDIIERQVKHLARLIDDLLDVSRITRGKIELRRQHLDATPVINSAVDAVLSQIEEKKQEISVSFTPGGLWCDVDPTRLEQILVNLLTNATRYTPASGHIRLTARHEGEQIIFRVKDTGIGIPPEKLPEMFELFAQGDRTAARSEGGLGIGLTIVKSITELHGGNVAATSDGPGTGSEFTVSLPAIPPVKSPDESTPPDLNQQGRCSRILIVDDNVDTARGLARLLRLLGHEIRTASDGPDAIEQALEHRPEIILLDIGLPGMDGYEVARHLRQEGLSDAVIIAISGYGQDDDRRRAREAGFDHHLVKPVDYNALISLISQPG